MGGGLPEVWWWWWCVGLWTTDVATLTQTHFSGTSSLVAHCTLDLGEFNGYPKSVEVAPVTLLRRYSSLIDTAHHCSVRCLLCSGVADGIATSILVC